MKIRALYFARYRERIGIDSEWTEGDFAVLDDVRQALLGRSEAHAVLGETNLMCARNEVLCRLDEPVEDGDELAFFPPVTGG